MKLKHIKLSGFKSFVDATTIPFPSSLVAVVGPNGCGKSNVIDAVRWVLGESSAKYLRGESMQDVIFSGSTQRKPVGQAAVELLFDNSKATLGGEYAKYTEISVKRVVTRDGQSTYYLNGTRCRRRDVADVFLGTGLGPRSYAVIEQGMISRFIEAKPEDLRLFIEEAAGISKYKERRRETELRMQHTEENLARLRDLLAEHDKQLEHLKKQAQAAERYQQLKQEERWLKAQTITLRWQQYGKTLEDVAHQLNQAAVEFEKYTAQRQHQEVEVERYNQLQTEANQAFTQVQDQFYRLGALIHESEQAIKFSQQRQQQLRNDLQQIEQQLQQSQQFVSSDQQRQVELQQQIESLKPQLENINQQVNATQQLVIKADEAVQNWNKQWDELQQLLAQNTQHAQVEQTKIQHLEQNFQRAQQRIQQLTQEQGHFNFDQLRTHIDQLNEQINQASQTVSEQQQAHTAAIEAIQQKRQDQQNITHELDQAKHQLQTLKGKYASLEHLQKVALGQDNQKINAWLKEHNLDVLPRLGQMIEVQPGWEAAVERVLSHWLQAICVEDFKPFLNQLDTVANEDIGFMLQDKHMTQAFAEKQNKQNVPDYLKMRYLSGLVKCASPFVINLLSTVRIANSLTEAEQLVSELPAHESVITQQGIWCSPSWLQVKPVARENEGVISREREIHTLQQQIQQLSQQIEQKLTQHQQAAAALTELEQQRDQLQRQLNDAQAQVNQLQAQLKIEQHQLAQQEQRAQKLQQELQEQQQHIAQFDQELIQARTQWQQALDALEQHQARKQELQLQKEGLHQDLNANRQQLRESRETQQQLQLTLKSSETELQSLIEQQNRAEQQMVRLQEQQQQINQELTNIDVPLQEQQTHLQQLLAERVSVEQQVAQHRDNVQAIQTQAQALMQQRQHIEHQLMQVQQTIEKLKLEQQSTEIRRSTLEEQMTETQYQFAEVHEQMDHTQPLEKLEQELMSIKQRIEKLGAINLVAIEEYQTQFERKEYLDQQHTDLVTALETLQQAIRKIDRETRAKFKETFDKINENFQRYFPKLFGGGQASLFLTGEELLDTGITIMAHPPGKRNATIHLLSGGEKALTAVALVFSIFQLNPAPFCLLDEVDAPLDDANVGRFCEVVREMSEHVQFIFVTHNKLAMELAKHLIGVTMNEPGVSRLVSVNIDEAIQMATMA